LKRAVPQKVKPVNFSHSVNNDEATGQPKQSSSDVNRRACTSAAMIGLAISMGASSLLVPQQSEGAAAAEPVVAEPTIAPVSFAPEVTILPSTPEVEVATVVLPKSKTATLSHVVQEGQTLWQLAQLYHTDAVAIAIANNISPDTVLHVGQMLRIPATGQMVLASTPALPRAAYYGTAKSVTQPDGSTAPAESTKNALKEKQDIALSRLRQKRDELKLSLVTLPASGASTPELNAPKPIEEVATKEDASHASNPSFSGVTPQLQPRSSAVQVMTDRTIANRLASQALPLNAQPSAPKQVASADVSRVGDRNAVRQLSVIATSDLPENLSPRPLSSNASRTTNPAKALAYQVNPGDTLDAIAKVYGVSRADLVRANKIQDPNFIFVNQVIRVPQPKASNPSNANSAAPQSLPLRTIANSTLVASTESNGSASALAAQPTTIEVAVAPLSIPLSGGRGIRNSESTSDLKYNPYVENLKAEILQMREKYRNGQADAPVLAQPVAVASIAPSTPAERLGNSSDLALARQTNPEFALARKSGAERVEVRRTQVAQPIDRTETQSAGLSVAPATVAPKPQLLATSSLGSDAYDPLVQPLIGKMVSPDLPPLPGADRFLPNGAEASKGYIWPAKGVLTSGYGWRWGRMHKGIDIAAPVGTPIVAAASGVVITAGWNSGGYGNLVEIQHPDGSVTLYAHNNRLLVRKGQQVGQGEQIAEMGSTGYSTGPHSHFEVHLPAKGAVNPIAYLPR